jgi:hypothetical protein
MNIKKENNKIINKKKFNETFSLDLFFPPFRKKKKYKHIPFLISPFFSGKKKRANDHHLMVRKLVII